MVNRVSFVPSYGTNALPTVKYDSEGQWVLYSDHVIELACIRVEARAEALKEAAERATAFSVQNTGIGYGNIQALRDAILSDEPKE